MTFYIFSINLKPFFFLPNHFYFNIENYVVPTKNYHNLHSIIVNLIPYLFFIVFLLIIIAFYTLLERKIMASIQRRTGPNVVGFAGLLQALADGLKLIIKETIIPRKANRPLFIFAPIFVFILALSNWAVIPFGPDFVLSDLNNGILMLLIISGLNVYGTIFAG